MTATPLRWGYLLLALASLAGCPVMTPQGCRDMCSPRAVVTLTFDRCVCEAKP